MENKSEKTKWKKEISAAGVVYKKVDDKIFILLTMKSRWTFPKGDVLPEQDPAEIVVKAVKSTGIEGQIVAQLDSIIYPSISKEEDISKILVYYLMEYRSGDLSEGLQWVEIDKAREILTYISDKSALGEAKKIIV